MKSIIVTFFSIILLLIGSFIYFQETEDASFLPMTQNIDWMNQTKVTIDSQELSVIQSMIDTLIIYDQSIYHNTQSLRIDVIDESLFLDFFSTFYEVNTDDQSFNTYNTQTITTDGYELFIDTNGITGVLSTTTMNYESLDTAYFSSQIMLSNPPFNIQATEQQQMPLEQSTTQLTNLLNLNIEIDPMTLINAIDFDALTTFYFKMEYGYYIEADALVSDITLFGINEIPARISMTLYEGYLMTFNIEINSEPISINNTFIDNGEETLDLVITFDASYDYDVWSSEVNVPDESTLENYDVVDAFSIPDVTSIFQP